LMLKMELKGLFGVGFSGVNMDDNVGNGD
jgi:hypothetical protein